MRKTKTINRLLFLSLVIISLMTASGRTAENLLNNPGFELGNTSGWTNWGCRLAASTAQVHTGNYSLLVSGRTQSWHGPVQSVTGVMVDGRQYRISGWVRLQNTDTDRIGLTVKQTDSSGSQYHSINWSTGYNDR
jgi:hypothetical protein